MKKKYTAPATWQIAFQANRHLAVTSLTLTDDPGDEEYVRELENFEQDWDIDVWKPLGSKGY